MVSHFVDNKSHFIETFDAVADVLKLHIGYSFILSPLSHIFLSLCRNLFLCHKKIA